MMEFKWLRSDDDKSGCYALRQRIFVDEQGFVDEFDDIDKTCEHLLVTEDGVPVATARIFPQGGGVYHVGRVCVDASRRGGGVGRMVMEQIERRAREHGAVGLELGAQARVREFYERCGYHAVGEVFYEQDCPHVTMVKKL